LTLLPTDPLAKRRALFLGRNGAQGLHGYHNLIPVIEPDMNVKVLIASGQVGSYYPGQVVYPATELPHSP
jgi:hypothetical protein